MATARETIVTGLEALRVLGFGRNLPSAHADYCLKQLNAYIWQLLGFGASLPMQTVRASGAYQVGTRWPALRVLMQAGGTVTLPQEPPADGMRLEVVDAANAAATSNITIARNSWLINGAASNYSISTNGGSAMLMWRADLGDWKVIPSTGFTIDQTLPFPADFDEAIALNAAKRYGRFGQSLSRTDEELAEMGATRLAARYAKPPAAIFDPAVSGIGGEPRGSGYSVADFINGVDL